MSVAVWTAMELPSTPVMVSEMFKAIYSFFELHNGSSKNNEKF